MANNDTQLMKAMVWTNYGPPNVLQPRKISRPVPKDNEVLIKVHAATVTAGDCEMRRFDLPGWIWLPIRLYMGILKPRIKILGQEFAGEIETLGKNITKFKKGDQVFGPTQMSFGAYSEYLVLPENYAMATIARNMSYQEAATVPTGGLNALHFLRKGQVQPGDKVLIIGAAGSIGTYAVQIAKSWGAEVTSIDRTEKLQMLGAIGSDHVIDFTKEDFTKNGKTYDVIIDVVGKNSFSRSIRSLNSTGYFIIGNPRINTMIQGLWASIFSGKKVVNALAGYKSEDLIYLKQLIENNQIKSVIDRCFPLMQLPEAHAYVEEGHKNGNVVIAMDQ